MLTEGTIEEVRVLQTVTLLLTTSDIARGITLSKCLVICFNLHFNRGDQTVANTASATVRQLVSLVFERILSEDKTTDCKEPREDAESNLEELKALKGVSPKSLQPFAGDAFLLFQDLISLVNGDQPSWLIGMNEMTRTFGLELLEMILSTYPAVFFSHPEFVFLLKERVCALVIKLFSPNVKHQSRSSPAQQAASQDKPYYPVSLRLLRLVTVLVQKYYKILVTECEIFLSLLVKFLDPDRAVWQRCLALEALHKLLAQPNLLKSIVVSYDLKPHASPILQDTVNALSAFIQSVFVLPQVVSGTTATVAAGGSAQNPQVSSNATAGTVGLSGFYYRGVWIPLLTNLLTEPQRNTFLDGLDKSEPPGIPDGYGISVAYACLLSVIKSITILIEEETEGDGDITSMDKEERKLKVQLINSSWCGLLNAISMLLEASTDEVGTDSLLRALEGLAGLTGRIKLDTPRDAIITAICRASLPPHYGLAVLGVSPTSKGHAKTGSNDQAYYQSLQQQANDNDYRPHVVAVGTPLVTPGMPQGIQQGPVMLTAKNLQVMRSILTLAQKYGSVLEVTSWNVILITLQHLSWILGIKPIAGGIKGRNPLVDSNNVLTTAVMADIPIVSSMMVDLFETSNMLDDWSLRQMLDGLCKLSNESMEVAYSNREPSFFGVAKLLEISLVNLHRLEMLWKQVTDNFLQLAFHPSLRLREWGVEALTSLIRAAIHVKFEPPLKQNQKIQALLLGPLVDLSTTTYSDVRQRQLDCVLGVLHARGESLTEGWPLVLETVGALTPSQSESLVRAAFQCMQLIVTDFLPIIPIRCLPLIVETVGCFGSQTQELNVSLTSIGMLVSHIHPSHKFIIVNMYFHLTYFMFTQIPCIFHVSLEFRKFFFSDVKLNLLNIQRSRSVCRIRIKYGHLI
ncbi:hypothetical protein QYM36_012656 [Artemia franciscana]|uniref:Protein MON2 homolog n=1 Tax=Artemia franciscana TaxID=6661 RepID=A0AA88KXU8_ARTSF|nr:hypothetical protein QYM36_012656 [Artemia franciscana]